MADTCTLSATALPVLTTWISIDALGAGEFHLRSLDVELQIGAADQHRFGHFGGQAAVGRSLGANHQLAGLAGSQFDFDRFAAAGRQGSQAVAGGGLGGAADRHQADDHVLGVAVARIGDDQLIAPRLTVEDFRSVRRATSPA